MVLANVEPTKRRLDAWPELDRADLGLFGPERQALVFEEAYRTDVAPGLIRLGLL